MLNYLRHFGLLAGAALGLSLALLAGSINELFQSLTGIRIAFTIYAALHALSLVSSLRAGGLGRRVAFVATAAVLCAAVAVPTSALMLQSPRLRAAPIIIAAGAVGALAYAGAIRGVLGIRLAPRVFLAAAVLCAVALAPVAPFLEHILSTDGLLIAIPWWAAFSLALWMTDAGRRAVEIT
jgi:hypothetical protein